MKVLRVDPIACDGHGLCAELFPERVRLDDWGYPIVDPEPIPAALEAHARRAVAACPTLALNCSAHTRSAAIADRGAISSEQPDPPGWRQTTFVPDSSS